MAKTIKVLSGGGFVEQSVTSDTLGNLRTELGIGEGAVVSINSMNITDNNHAISEGDVIAAVQNDKTGGLL
tara:strand:- start:14446 stop:14658 length:213 start_codon:yes stop_codon:yes gene_type:complete